MRVGRNRRVSVAGVLASRFSRFSIICVAVIGCGPQPSEQTSSSSAPLVAYCGGETLASLTHSFRSTGRKVIIDTCQTDGSGQPSFAVRDALTGQAVDLDVLGKDDSQVFHDVRGTIEGKAALALDAKPSEKFDAHVWFRIDLSDAPDKEVEVANPGLAVSAAASREGRTRGAATALVAKIGSISGLDVVTKTHVPVEYGVPVLRVRGTRDALYEVGKLPWVWRVMLTTDEVQTHSSDYYCTTGTSSLDALGKDGTGQTIAILEWDMVDSYLNLPTAVSDPNGCLPKPGYGTVRKKCHCPGGQYEQGGHIRLMAGVAAGSTSFGGIADEASLIFANWLGCATNGPDEFSSALNWATTNGARVISRSEGYPPPWESWDDGMQSSRDFLVDYKISVSPYPFVAESSGNDPAYPVSNPIRNGVVVAGADETNACSRSAVVSHNLSWSNPNGADGFEIPHLVAISVDVDSVGATQGQTEPTGGSSAATPQVAATVASLHEDTPSLKSWPEVVVPGLLVSANEDIDGTALRLNDGYDDRDGAGLLNGYLAWDTLTSARKVNGGNPSTSRGHDYGNISASATPPQTVYSEVWNATVGPYGTLRVAALLQSRPNCPANPGCNESSGGTPTGGCTAANICSANPYVHFSLQLHEFGYIRASSENSYTSYQFIRFVNERGYSRTFQVKLVPINYNGLSGTTWGVAWSQE
jgi:hypothetical protein